jgi:hypothetical protein
MQKNNLKKHDSEDKCKMRHPNPCTFGSRCRFHKKAQCLFSHDTSSLDITKLETRQISFKDQFNKLETQFTQMQKKNLKKQDSENKHWKGKCNA